MARLLTVLLALTIALTVAPAAPVPKDRVDQPHFPTKVGAKWSNRLTGNPDTGPIDDTFTVTAVETKDGVATVTIQREIEKKIIRGWKTTVSKEGVFDSGRPGQAYDPPLPVLKYPLKVGSSWSWKGTYCEEKRTETRTVKGVEAVEVPAGKFDAVRIEVVVVRDGSDREDKSTEWYAPGVGRVKWASYNLAQEMTSFTPGKE